MLESTAVKIQSIRWTVVFLAALVPVVAPVQHALAGDLIKGAQTAASQPEQPGNQLSQAEPAPKLHLSDAEAVSVGNKVWRNECGGRIDGLTSWNVGEDFPSLGIGHFIWYPVNAHDKFEESFPRLVAFPETNHARVPAWLNSDMRCPWNSREEFLRDFNGNKLTELRACLQNTVPLQTKFILQRLEQNLPKILEHVSSEEQPILKARFYNVLTSGSAGTFALIDYVNFKGEGVNEGERYKGQGWGLLQVLEGMSDKKQPVSAFRSLQ